MRFLATHFLSWDQQFYSFWNDPGQQTVYSGKKYYEKVVVGQLVSDSEKSTKLICSEKESFNENYVWDNLFCYLKNAVLGKKTPKVFAPR